MNDPATCSVALYSLGIAATPTKNLAMYGLDPEIDSASAWRIVFACMGRGAPASCVIVMSSHMRACQKRRMRGGGQGIIPEEVL